MRYLLLFIFLLFSCSETSKPSHLTYNKLSSEEAEILLHKGTEKPFSGEYNKHYKKGSYACRQCNTLLFPSTAKFDSNTGWPSFDDAYPEALQVKADFSREEIVCATCKGHLGHVFKGEGFTPKDTRHCVNSLAIKFIAEQSKKKAIFASGCFWGTDYWLRTVPGVLDTKSGYIGGSESHPTYEDVCTGSTGHYEAVEVTYDENLVDYETLARMYFNTHNPEQANGQGNDIGSQYLPAIFYLDEEQKRISEKLLSELRALAYKPATELIKAPRFWPAENYHQDYYIKNGKKPYCHFYRPKFGERVK